MATTIWKCQDCEKKYKDAGTGFCKECGGLILPVDSMEVDSSEESKIPQMPTSKVMGQCGLGILVFDFSSSMGEAAFRGKNLPQRKIDLVAQAFELAMQKLVMMSNAENAYVAVIGFAREAKLLKFMNAAMIDPKYNWKDWIYRQQLKLLETSGDGTNVTAALKIARKLYDQALRGNLEEYGIKDFAPLYHDILIEDEVYSIPNVRVFLYSDGMHNEGEFVNYFENVTLIEGIKNVTGLMCAYFGTVEEEGFELLYHLAGTCPRHSTKGIIHVIEPEMFPYIRQLFHMASSASGFCAQCAKESFLSPS